MSMYYSTRKMIEKQMANPNLSWTDADKAMFQGIADYTETIQPLAEEDYLEATNPGGQLQEETPTPEEEPDEQS